MSKEPIEHTVYWLMVDLNGGFYPDNKKFSEAVVKLKKAFTDAGWKAPSA